MNMGFWPEFNFGLKGGPGVVVKSYCLESRRSRSEPRSGIQVSKKQNVSSPLTFNIVQSLRDWEVDCAGPQTTRARISYPVSVGQCFLIHLTILRRFSWLSLAYICTNMAFNPIHYIFVLKTPNHHSQNAHMFAAGKLSNGGYGQRVRFKSNWNKNTKLLL